MGDDEALLAYQSHPDAKWAAPDWDHFTPVLYAAGGRRQGERPLVMQLEYMPGISMTAFGYGIDRK